MGNLALFEKALSISGAHDGARLKTIVDDFHDLRIGATGAARHGAATSLAGQICWYDIKNSALGTAFLTFK